LGLLVGWVEQFLAVPGSSEIIRDLVEGGGSILVIGPPGVGETTVIR